MPLTVAGRDSGRSADRRARRAARRRVVQDGRAEHDDRDRVGDRPAGVPAAGRGEQRVDDEPLQVLEQRRRRRRRTATPSWPGHRDAEQRTASRRGSSAGRRRTPRPRRTPTSIAISRAAGDPARQQPGAHPDPGGHQHLERQPRPDAGGHQRRREQRRAAEHEAEPGPEDPAGQDQQEEHQLDAGRCRRRAPRSTALTALSTPRIASTRGSRPPSLTSASTTAITSGSSARNRNGGSTRPLVRHPQQQRPDEHHQPGHRGDAEDQRRARRTAGRRRRAALTMRLAASTSSTRSHGGPSTLVTCGANAGDSATTSAYRAARRRPRPRRAPRRRRRPGRRTRRRGWPPAPRGPRRRASRRIAGQRALGGVVEAAGRLVEQQHPRAGGEHERQREGEPLALGEVARVLVAGDAGHEPVEQRAAACRPPAARRRPRTPRRRSRGRAGRRRSAAPARPAPGAGPASSRGRVDAVDRRRDAGAARRRCPGAPTAATTCRSRCGPSAR